MTKTRIQWHCQKMKQNCKCHSVLGKCVMIIYVYAFGFLQFNTIHIQMIEVAVCDPCHEEFKFF